MSEETDARAREAFCDALDTLTVEWDADDYRFLSVITGDNEAFDAFLTALADAGIRLAGLGEVVVDAGRFERLQNEAAAHYAFRAVRSYLGPTFLQPGDLAPIPAPDTTEAGQGL